MGPTNKKSVFKKDSWKCICGPIPDPFLSSFEGSVFGARNTVLNEFWVVFLDLEQIPETDSKTNLEWMHFQDFALDPKPTQKQILKIYKKCIFSSVPNLSFSLLTNSFYPLVITAIFNQLLFFLSSLISCIIFFCLFTSSWFCTIIFLKYF